MLALAKWVVPTFSFGGAAPIPWSTRDVQLAGGLWVGLAWVGVRWEMHLERGCRWGAGLS